MEGRRVRRKRVLGMRGKLGFGFFGSGGSEVGGEKLAFRRGK